MSRQTAAFAALAAVLLAAGVAGLLVKSRSPAGPVPPTAPTPPPVAPSPEVAPEAGVADTRLAALGGGGPLIGLADNVPTNMTDPSSRRPASSACG